MVKAQNSKQHWLSSNATMPRPPSKRAKIPFAVSLAVKQGAKKMSCPRCKE
jgi:hypothetical protein